MVTRFNSLNKLLRKMGEGQVGKKAAIGGAATGLGIGGYGIAQLFDDNENNDSAGTAIAAGGLSAAPEFPKTYRDAQRADKFSEIINAGKDSINKHNEAVDYANDIAHAEKTRAAQNIDELYDPLRFYEPPKWLTKEYDRINPTSYATEWDDTLDTLRSYGKGKRALLGSLMSGGIGAGLGYAVGELAE